MKKTLVPIILVTSISQNYVIKGDNEDPELHTPETELYADYPNKFNDIGLTGATGNVLIINYTSL